jgi:hypothetical protein
MDNLKKLKYFKFILTIISIHFSFLLFGQPEPKNIAFTCIDTLKFYKADEIDTSATLEWLFISPWNGVIVDSLDNPKTYFIKSEDGVFIAKKVKKIFYVFEVMKNSSFVGNNPYLEFSQINFSGLGSDLLIKWNCSESASSYEGSFSESKGGVQIWNLKKAIRYLDIKNYYGLGVSYNEIYSESGDTLHPGGDYTDVCQEYKVVFKPKELTIQYSNCLDPLKNKIEKEEEEICTYIFTPSGLVRRK